MSDPYVNDECIILKRIPFNESDARIIFLGCHLGKVHAIAKGIEKPASKLSSLLNIGSVVTVNFYSGKSGLTLLSATQICGNSQRFQSFEVLLTSVYLCELVDETIEESAPQKDLYDLLSHTLGTMDDTNLIEERLFFEWRFLNCLGYASENIEDFYCLCQSFWNTSHFSMLQQAMLDEICSFLNVCLMTTRKEFSFCLSKQAREVLRSILNVSYKKHLDVKVKSKIMLDEATIHFYS